MCIYLKSNVISFNANLQKQENDHNMFENLRERKSRNFLKFVEAILKESQVPMKIENVRTSCSKAKSQKRWLVSSPNPDAWWIMTSWSVVQLSLISSF